MPPLHLAALHGDLPALAVALAGGRGVGVNTLARGLTPLHAAAKVRPPAPRLASPLGLVASIG